MSRRFVSGLLGVLVSFVIGAAIMLPQGYRPIETYGALLAFSVVGAGAIATTLANSVPLVLTGLSASLAFGSGAVNLGQPGQLVMGAMAATVGGLLLDLPAPLMIPVMILLAATGGAAWAGLAAGFRQWFGMSEFITTLMLNMIADFFTLWVISGPLYDPEAFSPMTRRIAESGRLPEIAGFNLSILVMAIAFGALWFVARKTVAGYEWRLTGNNSIFARLGGCEVEKNYVAVMLVSGALAGLAGGLVVMAGPARFLKGLGANYAWDGVMIAVVAANRLPGTLVYGIFFAILQTGALGMELITAMPSEFVLVLQAVIVLVVVAGRGTFDIVINRRSMQRAIRERE